MTQLIADSIYEHRSLISRIDQRIYPKVNLIPPVTDSLPQRTAKQTQMLTALLMLMVCSPSRLHTWCQPEPVQDRACRRPGRRAFLDTECVLLPAAGCWFQWKRRSSRSRAWWHLLGTGSSRTLRPCGAAQTHVWTTETHNGNSAATQRPVSQKER